MKKVQNSGGENKTVLSASVCVK